MKWFLIFCSVILFIGVANLPIGYYTFLRIVTFIGAVVVIATEYQKGIIVWIVLFGITAILFNPIFPIYLHDKDIWRIIDILGGILFLVKLIEITKEEKQTK